MRPQGAVEVHGLAQAGPAEDVPFAAAGEEMLDQRLNHPRLVLLPTNQPADLCEGCIGAEELHDAQQWRPDARDAAAHQRRDPNEAAIVATHDMAEELVVENHTPVSGEVFPPRNDPGRRGVWSARRDLTVELVPFGGDVFERVWPGKPLDYEPLAHRKTAALGVSKTRDNTFGTQYSTSPRSVATSAAEPSTLSSTTINSTPTPSCASTLVIARRSSSGRGNVGMTIEAPMDRTVLSNSRNAVSSTRR